MCTFYVASTYSSVSNVFSDLHPLFLTLLITIVLSYTRITVIGTLKGYITLVAILNWATGRDG